MSHVKFPRQPILGQMLPGIDQLGVPSQATVPLSQGYVRNQKPTGYILAGRSEAKFYHTSHGGNPTPPPTPETVVFTYTFDTDRQDFQNVSGTGITFVSGDGSDFTGASAPGCVRVFELANTPTPQESVFGPTDIHGAYEATWETWGVTPGALVTNVNMRCRLRVVSETDINALHVTGGIARNNLGSNVFLASPISADIFSNSGWTTINGTSGTISPTYGTSSTPVIVEFDIVSTQNTGGIPAGFDVYIDTMELTITFTP